MNIGNVKYKRGNPSIERQTMQWPKEIRDKALHR